jgi:hypothetical protein
VLRHLKSHQVMCRYSETGETPWWYNTATYRHHEETCDTIDICLAAIHSSRLIENPSFLITTGQAKGCSIIDIIENLDLK